MTFPGTLKWIGLALLGLAIAAAVALAATDLVSRQIGIDSESIQAGNALAPAFVSGPKAGGDQQGKRGGKGEGDTTSTATGGDTTATEPAETTDTVSETEP